MKCVKTVHVDVCKELGIEDQNRVYQFDEIRGLLDDASNLRILYDVLYKEPDGAFPFKYSAGKVKATTDGKSLSLVHGDVYE